MGMMFPPVTEAQDCASQGQWVTGRGWCHSLLRRDPERMKIAPLGAIFTSLWVEAGLTPLSRDRSHNAPAFIL
jgi:hypothetical protein